MKKFQVIYFERIQTEIYGYSQVLLKTPYQIILPLLLHQ